MRRHRILLTLLAALIFCQATGVLAQDGSGQKKVLDALDKALDKADTPSRAASPKVPAAQPSATKPAADKKVPPTRSNTKRDLPPAPVQTAQTVIMPGQARSFADYKPQLDHLFFFEAEQTLTNRERQYQNNFSSATARYIYWEIQFNFRHTFAVPYLPKLKVVWSYPDGSKSTDGGDFIVHPDWTSVIWTWGRGWDLPTNWLKGDYTVTFYIDGVEMASGLVTIF